MSTSVLSHADSRPAVLVASSKEAVRKQIVSRLQYGSWRTFEAHGGADALSKLRENGCRVLLLEDALPDLNSGEVSALAQARYPGLEVVLLEATGRPLPADEATSRCAGEVIRLLTDNKDDPAPARRPPANQQGRLAVTPETEPLPGMVGNSPAMQGVYELVRLVAPHNTPVLIFGNTGTGKELIARAIHQLSCPSHPMITINCAAIPDGLLESELFGYTRGAFTGAVQACVGRIAAADGGTLFLDEIGELSLPLQAKILRFLENGEVQRLGSAGVHRVSVRTVVATNVDLQRRVRENAFREDLYYRLSTFPIRVPPLTERMGDLVPLAGHFLEEMCPQGARLSTGAVERLHQHTWPGNVRELRHVIERASILAQSSPVIQAEHIVISLQPESLKTA